MDTCVDNSPPTLTVLPVKVHTPRTRTVKREQEEEGRQRATTEGLEAEEDTSSSNSE
jgi:hypothetical protein